MILKRYKPNLGFLLAGAVLMGVAYNVYYEINIGTQGEEPTCQFTLIP